MRHILVILIGTTTLAVTAAADEPYYVPHGLDAPSITQSFIADYAKPGNMFEGLADAKLVQAHALIFRARVDDRPFVVDFCVIGSEIAIGTAHEWLLMTFFRHPYGPRVGHAEWALATLSGSHSPFALRRIATRPTNIDIQVYLEWSRWDERATYGFKDVHYLYFPAAWRSFTGSEPIELKNSLQWPPDD